MVCVIFLIHRCFTGEAKEYDITLNNYINELIFSLDSEDHEIVKEILKESERCQIFLKKLNKFIHSNQY